MVPRARLRFRAAPLLRAVLAIAFAAYCAAAQTAAKAAPASTRAGTQPVDQVLLLVNDNSLLSRDIAEYYARRRGVPPQNICRI